MVYLVAGLGNPGKTYEFTRHNVGFMAIDYIAKKRGFDIDKNKFNACYSVQVFDDKNIKNQVIFVKPQTFMNLSGDAILSIKNYFKIENENILIIYDDIDLDVGQIRIRKQGSAGTHNGMRDIVKKLKTENFNRLRIGIGKNSQNVDLVEYVIGKFTKEDIEKINDAISIAEKAVFTAIFSGIDIAMNKYNSRK